MKTVLIVDPEHASSGMETVIRRLGHHFLAVPTASEALSMLRQNRSIDLIVTELQVPGMDGLNFLTAVRGFAPALPVIVVTGVFSIENYLRAVTLGVFEYLNKPVRPGDLGRIISIALGDPRYPRAILAPAQPAN